MLDDVGYDFNILVGPIEFCFCGSMFLHDADEAVHVLILV